MNLKYRTKYFTKDLDFLRAYNSPFKPLSIKLYVGKVAIGTPYFLPRRWVKGTPNLAIAAAGKYIKERKEFNKQNPEYAKRIKSFREIYEDKLQCSYAVPKRFGFNYTGLGWKTKWKRDDYRFEWSPVFSFVFFKWQIAISFTAPECHHYWECWLYYTRETNKTKSTKERLEQARKNFPCKWTRYVNGEEEMICYWDIILKSKWL
jgi:hypothetical protein